jgi:hypothetical protein
MVRGTASSYHRLLKYGVRGKKCTKPAAADARAAVTWTEALRMAGKYVVNPLPVSIDLHFERRTRRSKR